MSATIEAVSQQRSEGPFAVAHLESGLEGRSARGFAQMAASQALKLTLQISASATLARLLTPRDYGLVGMVAGATGILAIFGSMGLSAATVQRENLVQAQVSTLFWLNCAVGLALTIIAVAVSPVVAWFYGDRSLAGLTATLSIGFFAGGLGVQHMALLRRQMRFGVLSMLEVCALVGSLMVGIVLAYHKKGPWAIVFGQLTNSLLASIGAWVFCRWIPSLPSRRSGVRSMLRFGANLTAFDTLNYLTRNLDNILIGWRWGANALGQYAKAYQLLLLPLSQVTAPMASVAIPALSRIQDKPQQFRANYLHSVTVIAYLTMPPILLAALFSREIVGFVLGPQWLQAAGLFRILAISAILQPVVSTTGWLFVATGRGRQMANWGLISSLSFLASFIVGLPFGPAGVATAYASAAWILLYPCLILATRGTPVSVTDIVGRLGRPLLIGCIMAIVTFTSGKLLTGLASRSDVYWATALMSGAAITGFLSWRGIAQEVQELIATFVLGWRDQRQPATADIQGRPAL